MFAEMSFFQEALLYWKILGCLQAKPSDQVISFLYLSNTYKVQTTQSRNKIRHSTTILSLTENLTPLSFRFVLEDNYSQNHRNLKKKFLNIF